MTFGTDIYSWPQDVHYCNNSGDPLSFHPAQSAGHILKLSNTLLNDQIPVK